MGSGAAGLAAAETLREHGFTGKIVMYSKEAVTPYDRPMSSKKFGAEHSNVAMRSTQFFQKMNIDLLLGTTVEEIDVASRTVRTSSGKSDSFDSLLICPGANPRLLAKNGPPVPKPAEPTPGMYLKNIVAMRNLEHSSEIGAILKTGKVKDVVVVGSSFIGMEAASVLSGYLGKGKDDVTLNSVHVIGMETVAFERVLGVELGKTIQNMHEEKGTQFHMRCITSEFNGDKNGAVESVTLNSGEVIPAQLVIVGVGVMPATHGLFKSGVKLARDGGVLVDECLRLAPFVEGSMTPFGLEQPREVSNVFAAGDVAHFPYWLTGETIRVEHWGFAMQQGRVAALNMLGNTTPLRSVPFFWTVQHGRSLRYCGFASKGGQADIIVHGSLENLKFVAYYVQDGSVRAVASIGRDPVVAQSSELLRMKAFPRPAAIKQREPDLEKALLLAQH